MSVDDSGLDGLFRSGPYTEESGSQAGDLSGLSGCDNPAEYSSLEF